MPFLAASVLVYLAEAGLSFLVQSGELPDVTQSVFNMSGFYQRILTSPRKPIARYAVIVEIDPTDQKTAGLTDICEQRSMMTQLLKSIAKALPRVIVLDKYYVPHVPKPCDADPGLTQTIQTLRSSNIPLIIGRRVSEDVVSVGSETRYYLIPSMVFDSQDSCGENPDTRVKNCFEGVVNIDPDTRKLPLQWMVFPSRNDARNGRGQIWHDTIALSVARAYDNNLMANHPRLADFVMEKRHPYISFLKQDDFRHFSAQDILSAFLQDEGRNSAGSSVWLQPPLRELTGKIVLVGEINKDMDSHESVVGRMPGIYMQANFVEALLDDRYFRPVPILDYVLGFIILAFLELILVAYANPWWKAALLIGALCIASVFLLYLMANLLGWYVNPLAVGLIAILIRFIQPVVNRADRAVEA